MSQRKIVLQVDGDSHRAPLIVGLVECFNDVGGK